MNRFLLFFLLILSAPIFAQVGIGTTTPNPSAILDVFSNDKGLLIPKISLLNSTDTTTITNGNVIGLMVFNTISQNDVTVGFYYWDGVKWVKFALNSGNSAVVNATNGLNQLSNGDLVLGGTLNTPTTLTTSNLNTFSIQGLSNGNNATDEVVSINPTTGTISKLPLSSGTQQTEVIYVASNGQNQFNTPATYSSLSKISVYRNGVKIGLTSINTSTIQLESGVICNTNDEIRIVQLN